MENEDDEPPAGDLTFGGIIPDCDENELWDEDEIELAFQNAIRIKAYGLSGFFKHLSLENFYRGHPMVSDEAIEFYKMLQENTK